MLALGALGLFAHPTVRALWRGEIDLVGDRVYVPPHGPTPEALAEVDLALVHAELLPRWIVAASKLDDAEEATAFAELYAEAGRDPNLGSILVELRGWIHTGLDDNAGRALYLLWAWGDYLAHYKQPWAVEGAIAELHGRPTLQITTYRIHDAMQIRIGVAAHDVRFLMRVDGTALRESYLGATRRVDDHANVVLDRVADFAIEEVWPLLVPDADEDLSPVARAWAPAIRAEAARALPPDDLELLVETAPIQRRLHAVVVAVRTRRECARHRLLRRMPWAGPDEQQLERMQGIAAREVGRGCPSITPGELELLAAGARDLAGYPTLHDAVGALLAWSAQHVAIHEARHLADRAAVGGLDEPLECPACTPEMPAEARAELSGQLAAIAWGPSPSLAMVQACLLVHRDTEAPHASAMRLLTTRLQRPCGNGPPPDPGLLARALELEMLGRSEPIALPVGYPVRVPMMP